MSDVSENWAVVNEQIGLSTIKRFPYKTFLGCSLTEYIIKRAQKGANSEEIAVDLFTESGFLLMLKEYAPYHDKIISNVKIGLSARLGENNTQDKIRLLTSKKTSKQIVLPWSGEVVE